MAPSSLNGSTLLITLMATALMAGGCVEEQEPEVIFEDDAMNTEVEVAPGVEVPGFSEEVRTVFRPPEGVESEARGTLRLLVPTQSMEAAEPSTPRIHVALAGLPSGELAWHMFGAPCGSEGEVIVPLGDTALMETVAEPLQVAEGGSVETEVTLPPMHDYAAASGTFSVRVFSGPQMEQSELLACANL